MDVYYCVHEDWRAGHNLHIVHVVSLEDALQYTLKRMETYFRLEFEDWEGPQELRPYIRELFLQGHHVNFVYDRRKGITDNFYIVKGKSDKFNFNLEGARKLLATIL